MRYGLSAAVLAGVFGCSIGVANASILYIDDANGNIGAFNTVSKSLTVIGNSGADLTDLGFSSTGQLYGTSFGSLYTINKSTGAATLVGNYGNDATGINALVGYGNGFLGASIANYNLYSIGVSPFSVSTLNGSADGYSVGDLTFGASGGALYGAQDNGDIMKYTLSGNSFTPTFVGNTGDVRLYGLATDSSGITYGLSGTTIYTVDLGNGALTEFANYSGQGLGDAYGAAISPVPLPASAPMFGAALLALAGFGYGVNRRNASKNRKAAAAA